MPAVRVGCMKRTVVISATILPIVFGLRVTTGQDLSAQTQVFSKIEQSYASRVARLNPSAIRYQIVTEQTPEWFSVVRKQARTGSAKTISNIEQAVRGDKFRIQVVNVAAKPGVAKSSISVYNGRLSVSSMRFANEFQVSQKREDVRVHSPRSILGEEVLYTIAKAVAAGEWTVRGVKHADVPIGDGAILLRLSFVLEPSNWSYTYLLAPTRDHIIYESQVRDRNGTIMSSSKADGYKEMFGLWMAERGEGYSHLASGKLGQKHSFTLESFTTNVHSIPESLFTVELPKGSVIFDKDKGAYIRNSELSQQEWDRVATLAAPPRTFWSSWICWTSAGMLLAAMAYYFRRSFYANRRDQAR